jgi:hypothetical protein
MVDFTPPLRATHHCRHYSYKMPFSAPNAGPNCSRGCGQSEPGFSLKHCCSEPTVICASREEYSDTEREAWEAARSERMKRLGEAVQALPHPIPLRTSGEIDCPNCDGKLRYSRWHRGAEIGCTTPFCCGAHFSIAAGADWPVSKAKAT